MSASRVTRLRTKVTINPVSLERTAAATKEACARLGLLQDDVNAGVFNGQWGGGGPVVASIDPATNQAIARIQTVRMKQRR